MISMFETLLNRPCTFWRSSTSRLCDHGRSGWAVRDWWASLDMHTAVQHE